MFFILCFSDNLYPAIVRANIDFRKIEKNIDTLTGHVPWDCETLAYTLVTNLCICSVETKDAIQKICEESGCQAQEEILLLPLQSHEDIMSIISETLNEETTLAVFDHCPVHYGFMLPVKEITLLCHMK